MVHKKVTQCRKEKNTIVLTILCYLLLVTASTYYQYHRDFKASISEIDSILLTAANSLDEILGKDFHDRFTKDSPIGPRAYRSRVASLNRLVDNLGIEFLYSMVRVDGRVYFVVSNETREDIERGTPSVFYNPYPDPPKDLVRVFDTQVPAFSSYSNQWNSFRSIFLPQKTPGGIEYVLAADIKAKEMTLLLINAVVLSMFFAGVFLLPILPGLIVYRKMMKQRAAQLEKRLFYDFLTGLPNQNRLREEIPAAAAEKVAAILMNVDAFKGINTLFGNDTGDRLLQELADMLQRELPPRARVYKMPSDEFAVLWELTSKKGVEAHAHMLLSRISSHIFLKDKEALTITMSAGICLGAQNAERLLACADMAKTVARKNQQEFFVYTEELDQEAVYQENLFWLKELKKALQTDRIVPYFQPILNNATQKVEKYEALVRLIDTDGNIVPPGKFLDLAKKSKLYYQITHRVIHKSLQAFSGTPFSVSLNFTVRDLSHPETVDYLLNRVKEFNMENRVILELVESEQMPGNQEVVDTINRLKKEGMQIAIDDFGSGYANFEYLLRLKADFMKIDGTLIEGILDNKYSREIVSGIASFAKKLNIELIAEYVSTREIQAQIQAFGIEYSQGFYIGRPGAEPQ